MTATRTALQERFFTKRFLERYGLSLTPDEIQVVQALRGLPAAQRGHLCAYAAGLLVQHASRGRVLAAFTELRRQWGR